MALYIIATPIGNPLDISLRALETLRTVRVIIAEERRQTSTLLKFHNILYAGKDLLLLNEHSTAQDLTDLVHICRFSDVALVSDCGTPGFCDPGADLVHLCREQQIKVTAIPGPSSMMAFLSLCGIQLSSFYFRGFIPAKKEDRMKALRQIASFPEAQILMDTPYRLSILLTQLNQFCPQRNATIGLDLTHPNEELLSGSVKNLCHLLQAKKSEFVLLLHSKNNGPTERD